MREIKLMENRDDKDYRIGDYNFIEISNKDDFVVIAKMIKKPIIYDDFLNEWNGLTFRQYHLFDGNFVYRFIEKGRKVKKK